jgi:hypothetical protein
VGPNFTWTVTGLSDGLSSDASIHTGNTLTISGTPTSNGTVTFQVGVQDSAGDKVSPVTYTIDINAYTTVGLPSSTLQAATVGQSYNGAINATGGIQTYTYTVNGTVVGANPAPLTNGDGLSGACSGGNALFLSGPPTSTGTITLNVSVTDGEGNTASNTYTVTVDPQSTLTISMSDQSIPQGMVSMPYGIGGIPVSGGTSPYTFAFTNLPSWASFDANGDITGTPTAAGTTSVTVKVTDSASGSAVATFSLPVVPLTSSTNNGLLKGQYACLYRQAIDSGFLINGSNLNLGATVFAIVTDGYGNITGGEADSNTPTGGYKSAATNGSLTGTYAVGMDNRGYFAIGKGGEANYQALAAGVLDSSGEYSQFRFTDMSDVGISPQGKHGGGICYKQYDQTGKTTLTGQMMSGGYVMGMNGEGSQGEQETMVGSMKITSGAVTGVTDGVQGTNVSLDNSYTGSVSAADSFGRVTFTCTNGCGNSVVYITNQALGQGLVLTTDPHNAGNDVWFGELRAQNATHLAAAYPLNGPFVMYADRKSVV